MAKSDASSCLPRDPGTFAVLSYPNPPVELAGCRFHVFRLLAAVPTKPHQSQSGYLQRGYCLVCGKVSPPLDASWWKKDPDLTCLQHTLRFLHDREQAKAPPAPEMEEWIAVLEHLRKAAEQEQR